MGTPAPLALHSCWLAYAAWPLTLSLERRATQKVFKGKKIEKKTEQFEATVSEPISRIDREYVFTHGLGNQEIVVAASKGYSLISLYRFCGFQRYRSVELSIRLPSDRDIAIGEKANVDEQGLYILDFQGARKAYHPTKEPHSPEVQQVFAHLLKDALNFCLSLAA